MGITFSRISLCLSAQDLTFSSLHSVDASSYLRSIPSPEQGASQRTISNTESNISRIFAVSSDVTIAFFTPRRSRLLTMIFARFGTYSFARINPVSPIRLASCDVFPPGALQESSTHAPSGMSIAFTVAIAPGSWTYIIPE